MADKWIAPRPGTDAALASAIAYVWIKDETYDKEYVATHTIGFEEFEKQGWHMVEWGSDELKDFLGGVGYNFGTIKIETKGNRKIYRKKKKKI